MNSIREQFPALAQKINGHPLVYLDSAATALKPLKVIQALTHFYSLETANVHRSAHTLSARATEKYEACREKAKNFVRAQHTDEIVFTKGTTESINLIATILGKSFLKKGDEIIISEMEHHSNIVPWQMLAEEKGLTVRWVPVDDIGELDFAAYEKLLNSKTKLVSLTQCSNTLGTVNDLKKYIALAQKHGALTVVDAAQSALFQSIDVQNLNCDFLVFSGHKLYGPYGIGVLYGKSQLLNELPPYQVGGAMISEVSVRGTKFLKSPQKFEAGTPNISGVIALSVAFDFVNELGLQNISAHEKKVLLYAENKLKGVEGIKFIGRSESRVNIISFTIDGVHASDLGTLLDQQGVAVRTGHHCTMPLLEKMKINSTVRASFGIYNNFEDIDIFINALKKSLELLK